MSGSSKGLQPLNKGKRPLSPAGYPPPKQPRLMTDEGKGCAGYMLMFQLTLTSAVLSCAFHFCM